MSSLSARPGTAASPPPPASAVAPSLAVTAPELKWGGLPLAGVDPEGVFTGYASLFGVADHARDVVERGAFAASLARTGVRGVKLLYQHDPAQPLGEWLELREDARGLAVRGRLMPEIAKAREVLALLRAGVVDGLSIGFRARKARKDTAGLRRLIEVELWEISVVTFPMLEAARVDHVKAADAAHLVARLGRAARLMRAPPPAGSR